MSGPEDEFLSAEIRAIIFDCDGTLADSMPVHFLAWKSLFATHDIDYSLERFYATAGMPTDRIISDLSKEFGKQLDPAVMSKEKEERFLDLLDQVQPVERVVNVVRQQHGERKMAVASGGYRWVIDRQIEHIGLAGFFDAIVTAEDTQRHKPHPDVFLEAAALMQVAPASCLVFEDADLGVEAARRAGMSVVDVRHDGWGSSSV